MEAYLEKWRGWLTDTYGNRYRQATTPSPAPPGQDFYEEMYRNARAQLRGPVRLSKSLRKHWQHQLWTARACLKQYFGADPPEH